MQYNAAVTILDRAGAGAGRRHGGGEDGGEGHHRKLHEAAAPLPGGGRGGHEEPDVSVAVLLLQTKLRIELKQSKVVV